MSAKATSRFSTKVIANIPFVAQIDSSDCGAACLSMICQYFKKDLILSEARHLCGNDATGQRLSSVARKIGISAQFTKKSFSTALEANSPLIAHWEGNHWVVIAGSKDGKVKIADPASGVYWLDYNEAEKAYSDYCLTVSSSDSSKEDIKRRDHVLLKCLIPFRRAIIASTFVMLVIIGVEMFIPYSFQQIIDEEMVAREQSFQWLITYSGMAAVIVIIGFAMLNFLLYRGAVKSENLVLEALLSKWMNLPDSFYKGRSFSELRARMESAFEIKHFLVNAAGSGLFSLLEIIAVFAMLEYYGFALKFAVMLLPSLILTFYTLYLAKNNAGLLKFAKDSFLNRIDDITRGVFSIRASSATRKFKNIQTEVKEEMYGRVYPLERKLIICEKGAQALGLAAWILLFFQVCKSYVENDVSSGSMFAVIILAALALNALARIAAKREKFENAALIYEYLNDVLDTTDSRDETLIVEGSGSLKITDELGDVFDIHEGEKVLLRGSSVAQLFRHLQGLSESDFELHLKADGKEFHEIAKFPQVSVMESNAHIFNMSLMENVALGGEVIQSKVRWCLRLALADHLIEKLPQGLNTKIIHGSLSEQDEKKLMLARCLYRERPLYLLGNLSSFMSCRELLVFAYHLKVHMSGKTVLVNDHSVELLEAFSKAAIIIGGQLRESGKIEDLLKLEKSFYKLYNG